MASIDELIHRYRSEDTRSLENIDTSHEPEIILALEAYRHETRVIDFFLKVARDEGEYDLAHIEVFKIFELIEPAKKESRFNIAYAIQEVLLEGQDDEVRNYAAMAASSYMDNHAVAETIMGIVKNPREPTNLRWNAFAAIKSNPALPQSVDVLRALLRDEEFKTSATRVLSEWRNE
jgi:hypothetical protein